jgi:hypothetical protein
VSLIALSQITGISFFSDIVDKFRKYPREKYDEDIIKQNLNRVRAIFTSLLESGSFTVSHRLGEWGDAFPNGEQTGSLAQNGRAMEAIVNTFWRAKVWKDRKEIDSRGLTDKADKTNLFHKELSEFYREKGVANSEEFVRNLLLRMSIEYTAITIFHRLSALNPDKIFCLGQSILEKSHFSFDFVEGKATVLQESKYEKKDPDLGGDNPQKFKITCSISLDPNNPSPDWDEVVTITRG